MFGDRLTTAVPWAQAHRSKRLRSYDLDRVWAVIREVNRHDSLAELDPRDLHATQPSVTKEGVTYYLGSRYFETGRTFADREKAENRVPVIYSRMGGQRLILTGHHRAAAAILLGQPLLALLVRGPWGGPR
jgi:hypothetical protein